MEREVLEIAAHVVAAELNSAEGTTIAARHSPHSPAVGADAGTTGRAELLDALRARIEVYHYLRRAPFETIAERSCAGHLAEDGNVEIRGRDLR